MRSTARDDGFFVASGYAADVANGNGIFRGRNFILPFAIVRTTTGRYTLVFDSAYTAVAGNGTCDSPVFNLSRLFNFGTPGSIAIACDGANTGVAANGGTWLTIILRRSGNG